MANKRLWAGRSWLWLLRHARQGWDGWREFCANCRAIRDSRWDQNETTYVSERQYLWLTLLLNAYCDFCAAAHSKFKVRWIYLSNTCWRKINFYDKWCDACLVLGLCGQPPQSTAYPLLKGHSSLSEAKSACCLGMFGTGLHAHGKKQYLTAWL